MQTKNEQSNPKRHFHFQHYWRRGCIGLAGWTLSYFNNLLLS